MAAVDALKGVVVGRLCTIFYHDEAGARDFGKAAEQLGGDAVGACADYDAVDLRVGKCLIVEADEVGDGGVGGGVALEIGKIAHLRIFAGKESLSTLNLLGYVGWSQGVVGREGCVVAVDAAAGALGTVAVGAGESGVDGYFLDFAGEVSGDEFGE